MKYYVYMALNWRPWEPIIFSIFFNWLLEHSSFFFFAVSVQIVCPFLCWIVFLLIGIHFSVFKTLNFQPHVLQIFLEALHVHILCERLVCTTFIEINLFKFFAQLFVFSWALSLHWNHNPTLPSESFTVCLSYPSCQSSQNRYVPVVYNMRANFSIMLDEYVPGVICG